VISDPEPLEIELGVSKDKRRITVEEHADWLATLSHSNPAPVDPIDLALEEGGDD
jgi:hypothetical protein